MTVTRFAPSPTGHLHKGHAYAALKAWNFALEHNGRFLLRIEDIDFNRCEQAKTEQIFDDLAWLGLKWETPVRIQSQHLEDYHSAADKLRNDGLLYPCFCTRKDILREVEEAGRAPHGSEGPVYPGICRRLSQDEQEHRIASGEAHALRLDLEKALEKTGASMTWQDSLAGEQIARPEVLGDAIIVRKDIGTSYHLAVVVDDGLQEITDIVRGVDLFESTHLHVVLQRLLGLPTPNYHHHALLTDEKGERLAKRNQSITLKALRESGMSPAEVIGECHLRSCE
ncbi:MAG: tRNA glutamyl-Q(34) synthetase GluQRS [Verrucomicrobiales bacterium]|nr:tRNA glutamyl-Q(34) synthetase GluQRS [Verrucomicrobiales bacterium]